MEGKTNVEDCLLQDKNNVMEEITAEDLSPLLKQKLLTVSCDNEKMAFEVQGRRCKCYIM